MINIRYKELKEQLIKKLNQIMNETLHNLSTENILKFSVEDFLNIIENNLTNNNIFIKQNSTIDELNEAYEKIKQQFYQKKERYKNIEAGSIIIAYGGLFFMITQYMFNQIQQLSEEGNEEEIKKILSGVEPIEKDPLVAVSAVPIISNAGEGNQEKNEPIKEDPKARNFSNTWKNYITTKNTLLALGITAGVIYTRKKVISWWDNKNKRNKKKSNNS
jgi:hypothetical protein